MATRTFVDVDVLEDGMQSFNLGYNACYLIKIKIFDEPAYIQAQADEYGLLGNLILQAQTLLQLPPAQARHQQALERAPGYRASMDENRVTIPLNGTYINPVTSQEVEIPNYEGMTIYRNDNMFYTYYPSNPNPIVITFN